nr:non-ribosomal peptide synthase/polyketide synthase [Pseudomonas quasicaspiana]
MMDQAAAARIARRFILLPLDKRKAYLEKMLEQRVSPANLPIPEVRSELDVLPLSYAQERQWFLWQLEPDSSAYHMPTALRLQGELDTNALEQAFNALVARHDTLRTTFAHDGERPHQVIHAEGRLTLSRETLPAHSEHERDALIQAFVEAQTRLTFDLASGPLLRITLLQLAADDHVLVMVQHHIVSDGWSMQVMVDELVQLYVGFSQQQPVELPALPIQYADYAIWQRHWMEAGGKAQQLAYWTGQLGDDQPVLELPVDRPRPAVQSHRGARLDLPLDAELSSQLKALAQAQGVTPFMLLLASFQVLLHRHSGQRDIRVGVPTANRNRVETNGLIGFFVNTQVLRAELDATQRFSELLQQVKQTALGAQAHQDLPFEQLVEALHPERSLSHSPLFQVMYNHQSEDRQASGQRATRLPGLSIEGLAWDSHNAPFDLTLDTVESAEGLWASMTYATDLFDAATVQRLAGHWLNLLQGIVTDPQQHIGALPMMSQRELDHLLLERNGLNYKHVAGLLVHQRIEQLARQTPDATALIFGKHTLSFAALNQQANRLAHRLIAEGVGPDVIVGIALERGLEIVVALLAVLKAGGAYAPLDPEYPQERLAYLMRDSRMALLLSDSVLRQRLPIPDDLPVLEVDQLDNLAQPANDPAVALLPDHLAYVIYTSGSTGQPKGVAVAHGPMAMHCRAIGERYEMTADDCELHFMSFAFDGAHERWLTALTHGGRLLIRDAELWTPEQTYQAMHDHGVTVVAFPPVYLQQLAEHAERHGNPPPVRIYCFGGDAVPQASFELAKRALKPQYIINGYGPTETVVTPLIWKAGADDHCGAAYAPIGSRIGERSAYVLDADLNLLPLGVAGELYLGGLGLARGYLNRPGMTAERFVADPFSAHGGRLYRTGDLVSQRADGTFDYLGRLDRQVKIRGFRIELGEVEARLLALDGVRDAVAVAQQGLSGQQLVGYIVPDALDILSDPQAQLDLRESFKAQLKAELPDYMVPAHVLFLERMPLTPNGKMDRKALPVPDTSLLQQHYVAPRNTLESEIAAIWQDVLKLEQVGVTDNFFELGGDSIISIQVVSRARLAGIAFTPKDLFLHQTVQALAAVARRGAPAQTIDQGPVIGDTPLLPIQQWFFTQPIPERQHWNQSVVLEPRQPLNAQVLRTALLALVNHHDALRLLFADAVQGRAVFAEPLADDADSALSLLWQVTINGMFELEPLFEEAQRSLDLQSGPLLRAVLADLPDGSQRLLLVVHHLVVDGVSWRILFDDLQRAYQQLLAEKPLDLPAKTSSCKAWAEQLQRWTQSDELAAELAGWQQRLSGINGDIPCNRPEGALHNRLAQTVHTRLDANTTRQLLQQAPTAYRTQVNDLLLTALARVIARWSGRDEVLVQLEGHGREELFEQIDLTRTVGWFTSLYSVCLKAHGETGASIKHVKEQLRAIPNKGLGFGALRYLGDTATQAAMAALPAPRITFNYLGQFDGSFDDEQALLVPAMESAGAEQSADAPLGNWLSINGQVFGGELKLGWTFSREMFDEATVQQLADELGRELQDLIDHCVSHQSGGFTPSDFPLASIDQAQLDALPLLAAEVQDLYPLAPMQQGMLFHSLYEQTQQGAYVNQMCVDVENLDPERFRQAWQSVVERHDILRSAFLWQGALEQPLQVVFKRVELPFQLLDWRERVAPEQALQALAESDRMAGFDLGKAPLLRLILVRTAEQRHHLIYTSHHILMDGWSNSQLIGEVLQQYAGQPAQAQNGRYRDYIGWLQRQDVKADQAFWAAQAADLEAPTLLAESLQSASFGSGFADHYVRLDAAQTRALGDVARQSKVTLNTLVQASWLLTLQRFTGQRTLAFGATVAGRPAEIAGIEQQIGLFINTLPVIASATPEQPLEAWLIDLQSRNLALREHEHTPLADIQRWAGQGGEALFDNLLVFENYPVSEALQQGAPQGLRFGEVRSREQGNYPLTLAVSLGESLSVHFHYQSEYLDAEAIEQVSACFAGVLQRLSVAAGDTLLGSLQGASPAEQQHAVQAWNPQPQSFNVDQCLHTLIEAQAQRAPDAVALSSGNEHVSYAELNQRANRLAHRLIEQGVGPDVLVGLAAERSVEMLVGLLAILKAGGAYVPLDPVYPQDRLAYMIEDSGLRLLLAQPHILDQLPDLSGVETLLLGANLSSFSAENPTVSVAPDNLAYVIYTSGSTGQPKGALLPHSNVVRLFSATEQWFGFGERDVWSLFHSYAFDFSVWEIFGALLHGGRLLIVPHETSRSPEDFNTLLCREGVTVLNQTPSAFKQLMQVAVESDATPSLRYVVFGGEALDVSSLRPWFDRFGDQAPQLINMYGITETTVHVTYRPVGLADLQAGAASPIGAPIPDLSWYLLDADLNTVPQGCVGELYVGQAGLARGYLNRGGLTATRFVPDPFDCHGGRLYRTGDLARYCADGSIEYIGRIDHQVKIRGFRIELGEIDARLNELEVVREGLVRVHEAASGAQLVAYVVPQQYSADPLEQAGLRDVIKTLLRDNLPDYMVPVQFLFLERMPLTANGKLDHKALPAPDTGLAQLDYVAPQSSLEQQIAAVWQDVLKLDQVGVTDNFFELGGDSIISIQVVSRARLAGIRFTPKDLFERQTVRALAQVAQLGDDTLTIDQGPVNGEMPLLPIQQWFFEQDIPERHHWNQSVLLAPRQHLDAQVLSQAVHALINHHDALRLTFAPSNHIGRFEAGPSVDELLWCETLSDAAQLEPLLSKAQRSLNLQQGPLLRVVLAQLPGGEQRLLLAIHHLVVDGVSWRILFEDLQSAYRQIESGKPVQLPSKTTAFKHWAEGLQTLARDGGLSSQPGFWQTLLSGASTDLPCLNSDASLRASDSITVGAKLSADLTRQLLQQAPAAYRTQVNDLLLTALARVIADWTGRDDVLVQLEGHGREALLDDADLSRTLGWFTSLFPVRLTAQAELNQSIKHIKEQLRAIPDKGIGFGVLRYLGDEATRNSLRALPTPRITFNYLGQFDGSFDDADALFVPAKENSGVEQSADAPLNNWLSINSQVFAGELSLAWTFSAEMFAEDTMQALADQYIAELTHLIEHCSDPQHTGFTPSDFPLARISQAQLDALPLDSAQVEDIYPLAPMQQGMLFHTLYEDQMGGDYTNQMRLDVDGLDPERFRQAWQSAVNQHAILRSGFFWQGGLERPLQVVFKDVVLPFTVVDLRHATYPAHELQALADAELKAGFDLSRAPLLRLVAVRVDEQRYHLIYTNHHILMDGWSNSQLLGEVLQRYAGEYQAQHIGGYRDYIAWLQAQDAALSEAFWLDRLSSLDEPTWLTRALDLPAQQGVEAHGDHFEAFSNEQTRLLGDFARQQKVTLNTVVQSAWLLLLQRYTGQQSVAFGATVSGRPAGLKGVEQQIGLFINTLPVIATPQPEQALSDWLQTVQADNLALREHEHTPLADIQRWSGQGSDALFDSILVFENYPVSEALQQEAPQELTFGKVDNHEQTHYPLTLIVGLGEALSLHFNYRQANFPAHTVQQIAGQLQHLLLQMAGSQAGQRLSDLALQDDAQIEANLAQWNPATQVFPVEQCLHQLIAAQAARTPHAVAVSFKDQSLSYQALDSQANRLAHGLMAAGVGPDVRVGIAVQRGLEMIVGLLAILKAGGAYVPLDPDYPQDRLTYMIEDSGLSLLLTHSNLRDRLPIPAGVRTLLLDADLSAQPSHDPCVSMSPENLAYVIYTSGSTGQPKGALLPHSNVVRLFSATEQWFGFNENDVWSLFHSYAFDFSVWEIFGALLHGGRLLIVPHETSRSPEDFHALLCHEGVTVLNQTPSAFKQLMQVAVASDVSTALRYVVFGGEALDVGSLRPWFDRFGDQAPQLINMYGITETTVHVTYRPVGLADLQAEAASPIGAPIPDLSWYLLDIDLNPVPRGCVGELYVGHAGLARGYLNRAGLTATRFVPNPFDEQGGCLYRTGDLARYCADGSIEYIGRIDHQVKIRGFRIELGEIEARLRDCAAVREAVVLAIDGLSGQQLVAWVVPQAFDTAEQAALRDQIKEELKVTLPDYMVPAHVLFMERMPLTVNGKLDRKALPKPDASLAQQHYIAPRTELEQRLVAIWQDVLRLERVGLTDNFFELGGDSIVSIQLVSRARQEGIRFTPKDLFERQTVQALAQIAQLGDNALIIDQGPVAGDMPLVPVQQWFFEQEIPASQHWNQSVLLAPRHALDAGRLDAALVALVNHHDALRLMFAASGEGHVGSFGPVIEGPSSGLLWTEHVSDTAQLTPLFEKAQRSLDLKNGPLLRAVLADLPGGEQRLLLVIHHLVVDGVSWRILFEDLQRLYNLASDGAPMPLPARTSSLKRWAERLQEHALTDAMQQQVSYWQTQLRGVPDDLPDVRRQDAQQVCHAATVHCRLDQTTTLHLLQQAPAAYRTQVNDLLLTALARVVARWTGRADVLIQMEGHGREDLFDDIDLTRTVGWFTSLFAVKLTAHSELPASIKGIKEQLRAVPQRGLGLGVLRYLGNEPTRQALQALATPRITFNYLGQFDGSFDDQDSLFSPVSEDKGIERDESAPLDNWLSINGQVYNDTLELGWTFSDQMFDSVVIQRLADAFCTELRSIVEHCVARPLQAFTPSDFPLARLTQSQLDALPVPLATVEDIYPLSPMQSGMLFHTLETPGEGFYISQVNVSVDGLDASRFVAAWNAVIERHEILRTGFWASSDLVEPVQLVYRTAELPVRQLDWRDRAFVETDLQALVTEDCEQGFDLLAAPLMRLTLVRLSEQRHQLIWTSHHILMDGWSSSRLLGEVFQSYAGQTAGPNVGRYRDYIAWLNAQTEQVLERFWKPHVQKLEGPTQLATSIYPRPDASLSGHGAHYLRWDQAATDRLRERAQALRITPNTLVQGAWLLLLQRLTGQSSVCFGATVAGRPAAVKGCDEMLGLFINTLPIVQSPEPQQRVDQWLAQLQGFNLEVRDHEHASLADVQRWSGQGGRALFDSIIVFENYPVDERLRDTESHQLKFGELSTRDVTNYAMDLAVELAQSLQIEFLYLRNSFTDAGAAQVMACFEMLLKALLEQPHATLGSLCMLETGDSSAGPVSHSSRIDTDSLPALIARHVQTDPHAVAVVCADQTLTREQLEQHANQLAYALKALGVGPHSVIGVGLERSVQSIIALYAVLKVGAAYVPMDIDYPRDRLEWIIEDSGMQVLLTHSSLSNRLPCPASVTRVNVDELDSQKLPVDYTVTAVSEQALAYLIYTSGSTGKPKGVAVARGPLRRHCQAIADRYEMDADTRELLFMSFAFDGAQERWLSTLISGGRLVVRGNTLWTPEQTFDALHAHAITIACFPPAYLQQLAEHAQAYGNPPPVRIYCFGGDAVADASFELVKSALKPRYITNGYGPTETVVTPLLWKASVDARCEAAYAPIGTAVGPRSLYVLDAQLNRVPTGVAGELYIGGDELARGYHRRPGLTAERFVADPFSDMGGRLYRTGDLVRQRVDGVFDYLGRLDNQVKIRGFRIELGEIEACLRESPSVRDAVVIARDSAGGKQLVGYVVASSQAGLTEQLRARLQERLPDYMVPAHLMLLDRLPLNPNGKVDRLALPEPEFQSSQYVAPRNALEQHLADVWQQVLEVPQVGVTDNFFELGGDSLRTLKVLSKVRALQLPGFELKLRDMMSKPTIAELSGYQAQTALDPVLLLNAASAGKPALFCLHAGYGTVFDYDALARRLDGQCRVYGVQCRMLLDRDWQDASLQSMAIDYAQYIRQKQPQGPYNLAGWSLGGALAVLVAQELESQGQAVRFVGLIDSFIPSVESESSIDWQQEWTGFLMSVLGQAPSHNLPLLNDPDRAQLAAIIQQARTDCASHDTASAYGAFDADDLAQTFLVGMHLAALAGQTGALPPVSATVHCWWAQGTDVQMREAFERALTDQGQSTSVAADHNGIVSHGDFLQTFMETLESVPQMET